jgi:autotransporter-associated beta strand protein
LVGGIAGSSSATVTAPIVLQGSQSFTAASGTTLTVSGGISQSSSGTTLTTGDLGTVVLGGTNTYTGGTVISNGTLQTTTSSLPSTGGANISSSAATLQFTQSSSGTYSGLISGSGAVTISGTGTVTLSNASNSYSGATNVESGVLSVNSPGALGTGGGGSAGGINFTGGTLQLTAPMTFTQSNPNQINFASGTTSTIDTDGNNVTMDEVLTGQGSITKTGGGDLTFTGFAAANVIGDLGVLQGTLTLNAPVPFGFSASPSGGTFAGDFILESGSMIARIQGGVFSGGGNIRIPNSGTGIVSQGATTISNPIVLNENSQPNFTVDIAANSANTLTITSAISGTVDPVQGVDFTGGAGIVYLTGQSTYTGGTYIDLGSAGEVQLDGVNGDLPSTSDVHLTAKATLDLYGNVTQTVGSLDSPGGLYDVANSTVNSILTNESPDPTTLATIIINGSKTTNFAGFITDGANSPTPGGALAIELGSNYTGTLWLNSQTNNNYAGGTILNGGTLILGSQGDQLLGASTAQGDTVVSPVTFGGGTLELSTSWVTSRPLTINPGTSTISEQTPGQSVNLTAPSIDWNGGALALTNTGASTLVQNGGTISVTHGSVLSVTSGLSLAVSGTTDPFTDATNTLNHVAIVNNGSFSVTGVNSSIAGITGTGALTVGDGSTTNTLQLAHQSGDSSQGSLTINGNSVLDITNNTMYIDFGTGSDPITTIAAYIKAGYNGGGWNGRGIVSTTAQTTTNGLLYGVGYADGKDHVVVGLTAGQIEVKYTLLGDANLDGLVNGSDFNILAANFNQSITGWDQGDFNYDGLVNASDFNVLAANFNQGVSGADVSGGDMAALDAFAVANGLSLPTSSVPEPATTGLLSAGVIGVLARRRRRSCE